MFELTSWTGRIESWWNGDASAAVLPMGSQVEWMTHAWRQRTSRFLDQQFWCFGQDILQPPRNALVEMGFTRHASPRQRKEGSCYVVTTRLGVTIALWGFGVFYADRTIGKAILLTRDDIRPKVVDQLQTPLGVWDPQDLPHREACESEIAVVGSLMSDLLHWFAKYENWITTHRASGHRERTLLEWKRVAVLASETAESWRSIAEEFRQFPVSQQATT